MINRRWWVVINFLAFSLSLLLAASLQTTWFYYLFFNRASVQAIVVMMTYICLTRKPTEALTFVVIAGTVIGLFSTIYSSSAIFAGVCIFWGLQFLRAIVYSPSHVYFTYTALGAVMAFHLIIWILGLLTEPQAPHFMLLSWILEVLITALFARAILNYCIWIDRLTGRLNLAENAT